MSLSNFYRNMAESANTNLPKEVQTHIEDHLRDAATRGKFEALYIIPSKWYSHETAIKGFLNKEKFSYEFNSDYQGKSFKIKF